MLLNYELFGLWLPCWKSTLLRCAFPQERRSPRIHKTVWPPLLTRDAHWIGIPIPVGFPWELNVRHRGTEIGNGREWECCKPFRTSLVLTLCSSSSSSRCVVVHSATGDATGCRNVIMTTYIHPVCLPQTVMGNTQTLTEKLLTNRLSNCS